MKTKEELLKIYSAYLPYDLEMQTQGFHEPKILEGIGNHDHCIFFDKEDHWCTVTMSQPILYSMDMLTKEIEHKGERFTPIDKLREWNENIIFGTGEDYYDNNKRLMYYFYNEFESEVNVNDMLIVTGWLLEWHFNVFGLDESEYIKKENL